LKREEKRESEEKKGKDFQPELEELLLTKSSALIEISSALRARTSSRLIVSSRLSKISISFLFSSSSDSLKFI
jgi:hypothetical protein